MKIALCTTTIHIPHALKLMRRMHGGARFFVAVDEKTPTEARDFVSDIDGAQHYFHGDGGWKCSRPIGFNTLARRNIAFLEALKWGADVVISWDNDNIPLNMSWFNDFETSMRWPFNGIKLGSYDWFDPGSLLIPPTRHRGFPHNIPHRKKATHVVDAKVGVVAGLVLGDPDIDAVTRMEHRPDIDSVHAFASSGVVVDNRTWTVFNTQNTAVIRELVPAWFLMSGVGRHDDIYASLIVQRVARERGYHVHFGQPFTYQERNQHNLVTDLRAEIDGMENVEKLANLLDSIVIPSGWTVVDDTRRIYETLLHCDFLPEASVRAGLVWLEDCESLGL